VNLLLLGRGKTGTLVEEVARARGHSVRALRSHENADTSALTPETLRAVEVVIDFTSAQAALENIAACARAGRSMVVGTTGWYDELPRVREMVEQSGIGFLYAANFSIGVNIFFDIAATAAAALSRGYSGHITERHHVHKKDAPSGTALTLQRLMEQRSGVKVEITSEREGDVVGVHRIRLESAADSITLVHEAESRRGYAEGAVLAAEWLHGRKGFYQFSDVLASAGD